MSKRFFTSDWHLNHSNIMKYCNRKFKSVERMNEVIINYANQRSKEDDLIIHVGDFYCYGSDSGSESIKINPNEFIRKLNATFVNIRGNHDKNNKVTSIADDIITNIGPYWGVHITHHPSTDHNSKIKHLKNLICVCGHVHDSWKYYYDEARNILNINVGIDAWKLQIISENELVEFISSLNNKSKFIDKLLRFHRN